MARPRIAFSDTVRQRDWLAAKIAAPFHTPVEPPVITGRPKPPAPAPGPTIIELLDAMNTHARPAEAVLTPPEFTPEEVAEVELYVAHGQKSGAVGDEARRRWEGWVADGQVAKREIMRLPGVTSHADVYVLETRLGWGARVAYATTKGNLGHGLPIRPELGDEGLFYWRTRDAAVAHCANRVWSMALHNEGDSPRKKRQWYRFADEMAGFLKRCGIDVMIPPPASMKRILVTYARERELRAGASPAPFPAAAPAAPAAPDMAGGEPPAVDPLRRLLARTVIPPSPLALRRRQLKEERERAGRVAAIAEGPSAYLAGIGLPQLEGLREIRGAEAEDALAALNARRPPSFVEATRIKGIRRGAGYCTLTLLLSDATEARVTARWQMGDRRYEWAGDGGIRHAWFQDTSEWFKHKS